jgi:hypothetical protein
VKKKQTVQRLRKGSRLPATARKLEIKVLAKDIKGAVRESSLSPGGPLFEAGVWFGEGVGCGALGF